MMLQLKGFSGFKDTAWIHIPRLTLLVGENDTGKTRILQALSLLDSDKATQARAGLRIEMVDERAYTVSTIDTTPGIRLLRKPPEQVIRDLITADVVNDDLNTILRDNVGYTLRQDVLVDEMGRVIRLEDASNGVLQLTSLILRVATKMNTRDRTPLILEGPEVGLHPKMQAKLAHLLTRFDPPSMYDKYATRCLVETHSKALLENLGVLVDLGSVSAEEIRILMFEKVDGVCTVRDTTFDDEGILLDWPVGFMSW